MKNYFLCATIKSKFPFSGRSSLSISQMTFRDFHMSEPSKKNGKDYRSPISLESAEYLLLT